MPFKDPAKRKEYQKKYQKEYMQRPGVREQRAGGRIAYYAKKPWAKTLKNIRRRCNNKGHWYHQQGIKCLLTLKDLEFLWKRDEAALMKNPSIDRFNSNGHYACFNCRYIELKENQSRDKWRGVSHDKR